MKRFWLSWTRLQTYGFAVAIVVAVSVIYELAHRTTSIVANVAADIAMLLLGGLEGWVIITNANSRARDSDGPKG